MTLKDFKQIMLPKETYEKLKDIGRGGDSFNKIIKDLINYYYLNKREKEYAFTLRESNYK